MKIIWRVPFFVTNQLIEWSIQAQTCFQFFIVMNVAVGGTGYFPDDATNPGGKPWLNTSPTVSIYL